MTVSLAHITSNTKSGAFEMIAHGEQMGSNLTLGLLLKWFPACPADEELTSSGTMAE